MRRRRSVLVVICFVLLLLEGVLFLRANSNSQTSSSSEGVFFKIWKGSNNSYSNGMSKNLRHTRFFSPGFRLRGNHVTEEQKRITPNGANPLHNR